VHLWRHVMQDIQNKGAAHNYSTQPNEKMHGSLKDAYQDCSNGKDIALQVHPASALLISLSPIDLKSHRSFVSTTTT
ncbi:hypothetical protein M404DRAFT_159578, partial [Pisolithus tinctorius Marx 270]